jgi:hypothetical protein
MMMMMMSGRLPPPGGEHCGFFRLLGLFAGRVYKSELNETLEGKTHGFHVLVDAKLNSEITLDNGTIIRLFLGLALQKNHIRFGVYLSTVRDFDVMKSNQIYAKLNYVM